MFFPKKKERKEEWFSIQRTEKNVVYTAKN